MRLLIRICLTGGAIPGLAHLPRIFVSNYVFPTKLRQTIQYNKSVLNRHFYFFFNAEKIRMPMILMNDLLF